MKNNPDALGTPSPSPPSDTLRSLATTTVLFAAGNDGDNGATTVGSPATSKNAVCVGASMSTTDSLKASLGPDIESKYYSEQYMAGFSSQGPTVDGRLKPDIAAPGEIPLYPWRSVSST
jgi:hypothetical protein